MLDTKLQNIFETACRAIDVGLTFGLVDMDLQSHDVRPIATGLALIGPYGTDLLAAPSAAVISDDFGTALFAVIDFHACRIDVYDISVNLACMRIGNFDLCDIMVPIHRSSKTAFNPNGAVLAKLMRDTLADVVETAAAGRAFFAHLDDE